MVWKFKGKGILSGAKGQLGTGSFVPDLASLVWKERKWFICLQEGDFSFSLILLFVFLV